MKWIKNAVVMVSLAASVMALGRAEAQVQRINPLVIGAQGPPQQSTNIQAWAVLQMLRAGVETNVVLAYIDSTAAPFGITVPDIMALRSSGMTPDVLVAMLRHDAQIVQRQAHVPPGDVRTTGEDDEAVEEDEEPMPYPPQSAVPNNGVNETFVSGGWYAVPEDPWRGRYQPRHNQARQPQPPPQPNAGLGSQMASGSVPGPVTPIRPVVPLIQPTVPLNQPVVPLIQSPKPGASSSR